MKAREYIEQLTVGGYDQAEYVSKEDALAGVEIARKEGYQAAVREMEKAVHGLCNIRQVLETLRTMKS